MSVSSILGHPVEKQVEFDTEETIHGLYTFIPVTLYTQLGWYMDNINNANM